jgi:hypothetical protein
MKLAKISKLSFQSVIKIKDIFKVIQLQIEVKHKTLKRKLLPKNKVNLAGNSIKIHLE